MSEKKLKIYPVSLGCAKNKADFEKLLALLIKQGAEIVLVPEEATHFWVNTCAFIKPAVEESLEHILDLGEIKKQGQSLIVSGCLTGRYGAEKLKELLPEVDEFYGIEPYQYFAKQEPYERILTENPFYAFLKISEGCNRNCAYCTIPQIRGRLKSKPVDLLLKEAEFLLTLGVKELILVAQDITSYGLDLKPKVDLVSLVKTLSKLPFEFRIRLLYLYPVPNLKRLLEDFLSIPKVVPYFDLPIQHAHPEILKAMRRPNHIESLAETIFYLRTVIPEVAFRTTVMVGFPGEGEKEFEFLCRFLKEVEFDYLGVFPFYPEEGTLAEKLPAKVPYRERLRRRREVLRLQKEISKKRLRLRKGKEEEVLLLGEDEKGRFWGISKAQAPEVDGITYLLLPKGSKLNLTPGELIKGKVKKSTTYDLYVEPIIK